MKSSIEELQEALRFLGGFEHRTGEKVRVGGKYMVAQEVGFDEIYKVCDKISSCFSEANPNLSEGWATTADLFNRLYKTLQDELSDIYKEISTFSEETYQSELSAKKASDAANDEAKNILDELGI